MAANTAGKTALLLAFSVLLVIAGCAGKQSDRNDDDENTNALDLGFAINQERVNRGVQELVWDVDIAAVEQAHAAWLAAREVPLPYMSNYQEAGEDGKLFPERLTDYGFTAFSEAQEYGYADETLTNYGLVLSLLPDDVYDAKWDKFGIGFVKPPGRESGKRYWVIGLVND